MSGCHSEAGRLFQILGPATEKLVTRLSVCSRNSEDVDVRGAKLGASGVCDQLAVIDQVWWSLTSQRLVDESGQLVVDPLLQWKPVQATKNWWDVVASASSHQKARRRILDQLQMLINCTYLLTLLCMRWNIEADTDLAGQVHIEMVDPVQSGDAGLNRFNKHLPRQYTHDRRYVHIVLRRSITDKTLHMDWIEFIGTTAHSPICAKSSLPGTYSKTACYRPKPDISWDWSLILRTYLPSVLWHSWLDQLTHKNPSPI